MMNNRILSILTNFGCHWGCRYCVYRENGINIPKTNYRTFGWKQLEEQFQIHRGETVSISGGGDPLYNYGDDNTTIFYGILFDLAKEYDIKLEMHTSMLNQDFPYDKFERVVFHLTMPTQLSLINNSVMKLPEKVRAVFVVQDYYTKSLLFKISRFALQDDNVVSELSFRQMINREGQAEYYLHDFLKEYHGVLWHYIEQSDYNDYFVEDHIETEYLNIKGDK